jgi:hypothetical protein
MRRIEWGNWGIKFWEVGDPNDYRTWQKKGQIDFPLGLSGPCDGCAGSTARLMYEHLAMDWIENGNLPRAISK